MTTSSLFLAVETVKFQIFNCYVVNVIGVNQIVAIVKFITKKLVMTVVKVGQLKNLLITNKVVKV